MAEQLDTMSIKELGRFQSKLKASCVSNHTAELWYNETVCLWMTIYNSNGDEIIIIGFLV